MTDVRIASGSHVRIDVMVIFLQCDFAIPYGTSLKLLQTFVRI